MFYLILNHSLISHREAMYRIYGLQLGPNFGVRPVAYQKFYLQLKVDQMYAFAVFIEKNLRPYGCSGTSYTAAISSTNPYTETQREIIEIEIIKAQI